MADIQSKTDKSNSNTRTPIHPHIHRLFITIFVILPLCIYCWDELLQQMNGSYFKTYMIISLALTCGLVDLNGLSGQPELDHDHDD